MYLCRCSHQQLIEPYRKTVKIKNNLNIRNLLKREEATVVYFQLLPTPTPKVTFQPILSVLHLHSAQDIAFPASYTVFRHCQDALWVMHDAAILVSRTVWVFNQPGSAKFYCLATAIPVTISTFVWNGRASRRITVHPLEGASGEPGVQQVTLMHF